MKCLPPRTYRTNARAEQRLLPFGVSHPAKMSAQLCRDLFLRYTLPGQTILDPFGGRGTSLIGCTLGRNVILHELEAPFVEYATQNWQHLKAHTLPGLPLGEATILQGDSRHLPFPTASQEGVITSPPYADALSGDAALQQARRAERWAAGQFKAVRPDKFFPAASDQTAATVGTGYSTDPANIGNLHHEPLDGIVTSPPFGAMNAADAGGTITQRPAKDGNGFEGGRDGFVYSEATPGQIGNLPHQPLDGIVGSPPYANSARDPGNLEAMRAKMEELYPGHVGPNSLRNATSYGQSDGQIGNLPHQPLDGIVTSPPYADVASRNRSQDPYSQERDPELKARFGTGDTNRHVDGYGAAEGQIGNLPHAVITSPPYADTQVFQWDGRTGSDGQMSSRHIAPMVGYGESEGNLGNDRGEDYASAVLAVYTDCFRVTRPGGVMVIVTGNYIRSGSVIDLAADTIALAQAAGWTPVERWRHEKASVSFWRRLHHRQGLPVVTHEDILVFCKGPEPGWAFAELPPTTAAPADLDSETATPAAPVALPLPFDAAAPAAG